MKRIAFPLCTLLFALFSITTQAAENSSSVLGIAQFDELIAPLPVMKSVTARPAKARCSTDAIPLNLQSPTWNAQAATTPCGIIEIDDVFAASSNVGGPNQQSVSSVARFGVTQRLEIRWGMPGHIFQTDSDGTRLKGASDQWLGALLRIQDQGPRAPDIAVDYAIKIPTANPAKGLGSGAVDHVITLIAGRDAGPHHVDLNVLQTIAGSLMGHDFATQAGFDYAHMFGPRLQLAVEAYGGQQPGASAFAALSWGASYSLQPALAITGGLAQALTAASPHRQLILGLNYSFHQRLNLMNLF